MGKPDLHDRLAALRIDVSSETRDRHLAAISEAVRTAPPVRTRSRLGFRRRWAVAIASLTAVVAPVGTAVAAEGALPGELLYPVKQVSEQIRGVFDEDLPARHRIEELERLVEADAEPTAIIDAQERAEMAVGALDQPGDLAGRLERARRQVRVRLNAGPGQEPTGDVGPAGPGNSDAPSGDPGQGDGSGDRSGDPSPDRDRDQDGTGDGDPTPTTGPGGDADQGGNGSGDGSGGGSGGGSDGSGGDGSGGNGSGGDASGGSGGNGSGSGSGSP